MQPQLKKKNIFDKDSSRYSNTNFKNYGQNEQQYKERFADPSIKKNNTFDGFNNVSSNVNENIMPKGYQQSNNVYSDSSLSQTSNTNQMSNEEDNYNYKHKRFRDKGGLVLIVIGILFILQKVFGYNVFSMSKLWPVFVLIPGLSFEFGYFSTKREPGLLVPGGILTTIGTLFFFETFTNWTFSAYTWPIYILSVAIGLFQLYIFGGKRKALLVPVFILTSLFLVFTATTTLHALMGSLILPIVLIVLGISRLLKK